MHNLVQVRSLLLCFTAHSLRCSTTNSNLCALHMTQKLFQFTAPGAIACPTPSKVRYMPLFVHSMLLLTLLQPFHASFCIPHTQLPSGLQVCGLRCDLGQ
jgi:hypothetical protein